MGAMWSVNYSFNRYKCADRVIPLGGKSDGLIYYCLLSDPSGRHFRLDDAEDFSLLSY
jgi:hypothetical protein